MQFEMFRNILRNKKKKSWILIKENKQIVKQKIQFTICRLFYQEIYKMFFNSKKVLRKTETFAKQSLSKKGPFVYLNLSSK